MALPPPLPPDFPVGSWVHVLLRDSKNSEPVLCVGIVEARLAIANPANPRVAVETAHVKLLCNSLVYRGPTALLSDLNVNRFTDPQAAKDKLTEIAQVYRIAVDYDLPDRSNDTVKRLVTAPPAHDWYAAMVNANPQQQQLQQQPPPPKQHEPEQQLPELDVQPGNCQKLEGFSEAMEEDLAKQEKEHSLLFAEYNKKLGDLSYAAVKEGEILQFVHG